MVRWITIISIWTSTLSEWIRESLNVYLYEIRHPLKFLGNFLKFPFREPSTRILILGAWFIKKWVLRKSLLRIFGEKLLKLTLIFSAKSTWKKNQQKVNFKFLKSEHLKPGKKFKELIRYSMYGHIFSLISANINNIFSLYENIW